jgi:heat shock protein beta
LEEIIRKYSEFINFQIYLLVNKTETIEEPLSEEELAKVEEEHAKKQAEKLAKKVAKEAAKAEQSDDGEAAEVEDVTAEDEPEEPEEEIKKTKPVERSYQDWDLMNAHKPLWTRDPKNVTEKEYQEFYKSFTKETTDPMAYTHFKAEGTDVLFIDFNFKATLISRRCFSFRARRPKDCCKTPKCTSRP